MVSFAELELGSGQPIYLQIIRYLKQAMAAGTVADGDEMPSRRVLSALLGVNPNTVQKAYRMLEEEGLIVSHSGAKSFVSVTPAQMAQIRRQLLEAEIRSMVEAMKQMGVTRSEAAAMMDALWEEDAK
jgi:GntR family transcriptional regulator